jgi:site-specific recombinase XerD
MDFREWLKRRGKSPNTVSEYDYSVSRYLTWAGGEVSHDKLAKYVDMMIDADSAPASVSRHYHAVRAYYRFMGKEAMASGIELPPVRNAEPRCIPPTHLAKLMSVAWMPTDNALIRTMYGCALRISELISITRQDLKASDGFLRIRGGKDRGPDEADYIPIDADVVDAIHKHLDTIHAPGERIFPYKYASVQQRLKRLCAHAGIPYYNPHSFRHGRLNDLAHAGVDIYQLKAFGRHRDIKTTIRYTHIKPDDLKKSIPRAFRGG